MYYSNREVNLVQFVVVYYSVGNEITVYKDEGFSDYFGCELFTDSNGKRVDDIEQFLKVKKEQDSSEVFEVVSPFFHVIPKSIVSSGVFNYQCGLEVEVDMAGSKETFGPYVEDVVRAVRVLLEKKASNPSVDKRSPVEVSVLSAFEYCMYTSNTVDGTDYDYEYDLLGFLDLLSIKEFLTAEEYSKKWESKAVDFNPLKL